MPRTPTRQGVMLLAVVAFISACGGGSSGSGSSTMPVATNTPPVPVIAANPPEGTGPLWVEFDASASTDPDGSIASYSWDFGDNSAVASGVTAAHGFASAGAHVVTLTVTDDHGLTASSTVMVSVAARTVPMQVGGSWTGKSPLPWPPNDAVDSFGLIAEDGRAYFLFGGLMFWGQVDVDAGHVGGVIKVVPVQGSPPPPSARYMGMRALDGTIVERTSIDVSWCGISSSDPTMCLTTFQFSQPYQPTYDDDSSLALIAGNYAEAHAHFAGVLNISASGDLFLQDPASGCVVNGHATIIHPNYNAYGIEFAYANCTDPALNEAAFMGLATYDAQAGQLTVLVQGNLPAGGPKANAYLLVRQ